MFVITKSVIAQRLRKLTQRQSAQNASWILLGQGASFLLQSAFFVLLARMLGAAEYGILAGAFSLVSTITPYSTLGGGWLFLRYVTIDRSRAGLYWGNALIVTATLSVIIAVALWFEGPVITGNHNRLLFVVLVFANCLFFQIALMAGQVFQAFEKLRMTAILSFLTNFTRFAVLLFMKFIFQHANAFQWAVGVLVASAIAAAIALFVVHSEIRSLRVDINLIFRRSWEGVGFSFAGTTTIAYNDIDKTLLSRYGFNRENGFYTLAYRIIEFATAPITAIDTALLPRYFLLNQKGIASIIPLVFKSLRWGLLLGIGIALSTLLVAPWVPKLVGPDYNGAVTALRWLCWIPLIRSVHRFTGIALTGTGHQNLRTASQFVVALFNIGLNVWLIPRFGWMAAVWSSLASDSLLAILNALCLYWVSNKSSRAGLVEPREVSLA